MLAWCRVPPDEFSISTRISIRSRTETYITHMPTTRADPPRQIFSNKSSVNQQCPINLIVMDLTFHVCVFFTLFSKGNTIITIPATSTPSASTDISRPVNPLPLPETAGWQPAQGAQFSQVLLQW